MSKFEAKVDIALTIVCVLIWIALFIAVFWGGYDTIEVLGCLLAMTFINYVIMDREDSFGESVKVIFSKEEESN